jgi:hypothetical protein
MMVPELLDDLLFQTYTMIIPAVNTVAIFSGETTEEQYPVIVWALRKKRYNPNVDVPEDAGKTGTYTEVVGMIVADDRAELQAVDDPEWGDFLRYETINR